MVTKPRDPDDVVLAPRTPAGKFAPGASGNPGGRKVYPDWFRARGDDALRLLAAVGTGVLESSGDPQVDDYVLATMAEASTKEKLDAAKEIAGRLYGKIRDVDPGDQGPSMLEQIANALLETK